MGGDASGDLGRILHLLPCVLSWGSCQEAGEGGGGGPLGSAPREYVGFLLTAPGDGSLLPPSAALNAQLLPYIFFPLLSPRVLLIHLESREPHICQHSEKAVGVFAEIALDI